MREKLRQVLYKYIDDTINVDKFIDSLLDEDVNKIIKALVSKTI